MTPLEEGVLKDWRVSLQSEGVDQAVIDALVAAYQNTAIPNAEQLLALLRTNPLEEEGVT